jgi:hypothetical protein
MTTDEAAKIFGGPEHITLEDLTPCEVVALLTVVRPPFERRRTAQRQPAPVLTLLRPKSARRSNRETAP